MESPTKPCIHAEVCADGCDLEDITECGYYQSERTCRFENAGELPDTVHPTVWFCSECGSPIYNDMKPEYCVYCGARGERDA